MAPRPPASGSADAEPTRAGYARIKRHVISEIRSGRWKVGDLVPSEHQLLSKFSVSRATVVRSLNELVLEGYLTRQRGKGTFVADYRAHEKKTTLPLFVEVGTYRQSGNARQLLLRIMYGIESALAPGHAGYSVRQVPAQLDEATLKAIDEMKPRVALVVEPSYMPGLVQRLNSVGCVTWAINEPSDECNSVYIDQEQSAYIAVKYLLAHGRRKIALLNGPVTVYWGFAAKLRGYRRAIEDAGLGYDPALVREASQPIDSEAGRLMFRALANDGVAVDGVVGASDSKTMGAMAQAADMGLKVHDDVMFIAIDNTIADQADPPLPAVELPFAEMGRQVAMRAMESESREHSVGLIEQIRLQPFIVDRLAAEARPGQE